MPSAIATIVNWYGPFGGADNGGILQNARSAAATEWSVPGLYAAVGKAAYGLRGPNTLRYMGVGKPLAARLTSRHHKLSSIPLSSIWLGEVAVPGLSGRKTKKINPHLDVVEWASVFFLKLPANEKKRRSPPKKSFVVVNRWWDVDYSTSAARPAKRWPDVLEYDADRNQANLVWFGLRSKVLRITP